MRKLNHLQALRLIDAGRRALSSDDQANLAAHLETCAECRAYAADTANLGPALAQLFHERWDASTPRANVVAAVRPTARRHAWKGLFQEFAWVAVGVMAIFALIGAFRFLLPQISRQPSVATLLPISSSTPLPTVTPYINSTPTLEPTLDATAAAATRSVEEAAYRVTETAQFEQIIVSVQPEIRETQASPDGNWQAQFIRFECTQVGEGNTTIAYEQLKLIDLRDGSERVVEGRLIHCQALGAWGLGGLFWSPNSRYFYYTTAREGGPDGCGYWEPDINRVDVNTGEFERLGNGPTSPDGTKLAMWSNLWQDSELVIWDVDQGEIGRMQPDDPQKVAGPIAWSPDSQALVYLQADNTCIPAESHLVRVDLSDLRQSPLPALDGIAFRVVAWENPGELLLSEVSGQQWVYDFASRSFEKQGPASNTTPAFTRPGEQDAHSIPSIWNYYKLDEQLQLKQPGSLEFTVEVASDVNLIWPFYWCAADADRLADNLPAISVNFSIDGVEVPATDLLEFERSSPGWVCHYWATQLSGWLNGEKSILNIDYHLSRAVDDGYEIYPAGDYHYRLNTNVVIP